MASANLEIVRRVYNAAARRDAATVLGLYDPEVELDMSVRVEWFPTREEALEAGGVSQ